MNEQNRVISKPILILPDGMDFSEFKRQWLAAEEKDDALEIVLHHNINAKEFRHCPYCGNKLSEVKEEDPDWGEFCSYYKKQHRTMWLLCNNSKCTFSHMPLVLHHPVYGWDKPAGDSFALSYVK